MHYDQKALYELFLEFQSISEGIEVTEQDLIDAWREAKKETQYFHIEGCHWGIFYLANKSQNMLINPLLIPIS